MMDTGKPEPKDSEFKPKSGSKPTAHADLKSVAAVHPMREAAVKKLLEKADADWQVVEALVGENKLVDLEYEGNTYYIRKIPHK